MKKRIFPEEIVEQSSEQLLYDNTCSSHTIYLGVIAFILIVFILLFFIHVDVIVKANGIIKPKGVRSTISSPIEGKIIFYNVMENIAVDKGDTLFVVESQHITSSLLSLQIRKKELLDFIYDLKVLIKQTEQGAINLRSPFYIQEHIHYKTKLSELEFKREMEMKNFNRNKQLFNDKVIPESEFEKTQLDFNTVNLAIDILNDGQYAKWSTELNHYEIELRDILLKILQIDIRYKETVVCSPVSGTIQKIENISNGTYIHAGQDILELSPNGELILECYIPPKDIGFVKLNQSGKIKVDAFNYNDWGMLGGSIHEVFDDIMVIDNQYYYKVYCKLDRNFLSLKNGYNGYMKKGMTASAQFTVTRRTIFQLLFDKVDNWINPNISVNE